MDEREEKNQIQCIVDEGIVINRRDMVRILRDLGHVRYTDRVENQVRAEGEGFITSVFSHGKGSTIFFNRRLYINVNSFDYLRLGRGADDEATIELVDQQRVVTIVPLSDPLEERHVMACDSGMVQAVGFERMFGESLAEVYMDEDAEDGDDG